MKLYHRASQTLLATMLAMTSAAALAQNKPTYGWCNIGEINYGRIQYVSTVFKMAKIPYHVGVQNAFNSHVSAMSPIRLGSAICGVTYDSFQEAEESREDFITRRRRDGTTVNIVHWSYRGD